MNNADLVWRLVELLLQKEKGCSQGYLENFKDLEEPNADEHDET